jgi:hypothetical protein
MIAAGVAWAQSPSQIQYIYDAAGNLIQVTRSAVTPQPDLTVSNLSVGVITRNYNNSFNIPVTFQVNNAGTAAAVATWYDRGYLSANALLHDADQALGGYNTRSTNLAAGGNYSVSKTFTTSATTAPGNYYLIVKADGGAAASGQYSPTGPNYVAELDENNNTQIVVVNLPANLQADLTVSNASVGAITVSQAGAYVLPVTYTVTNAGRYGASAWRDAAYLSTDAVLDNADQNLSGANYRSTPLEPGTSYTATISFTTTAATAPGNYTLFIKADGHGTAIGVGTNTDSGAVTESNETNNTQALALSLLSKPDLAISNLTVGTIASKSGGGYNIPVTFTVTNLGGSAATATWYDYGYLSTNATLENTDQVLGGYNTRSTNLAAGASYVVNATFTTSNSTVAGNYTLFVKADGRGGVLGGTNTDNGKVTETNESNNVTSVAVALNADVAISGLTVGTISSIHGGGYNIPVTFTVTNVGISTATATWYDFGYLSVDGTLDNADKALGGYNTRSTNLTAGASYVVNATFTTLSSTAAGNYTLFVKVDGRGGVLGGTNTDNGYITETSESNNVTSAAVALNADLAVTGLTVGAITPKTGGGYNIPVTFTVTNVGTSTATASWYDYGYLSTNATLENTDQVVGGYNTRSTNLAAGASYVVNATLTTNATTVAGSYTLFVKADGGWTTSGQYAITGAAYVTEVSESNNVASATVVLP